MNVVLVISIYCYKYNNSNDINKQNNKPIKNEIKSLAYIIN